MDMSTIDYTLKGRRIKLKKTDDKYTRLKTGDLGTINYTFLNLDKVVISVIWDSGSSLGLIDGVDSYEILDIGGEVDKTSK
jgi:hypothetical protein